MEKYELIKRKLHEFRVVVKELVNNACHGALLDQGFTPDDRIYFETHFAGIYKIFLFVFIQF